MIAVDIPGLRELSLEHLVLDYNGTLAEDGNLLPGVAAALKALAQVTDSCCYRGHVWVCCGAACGIPAGRHCHA